MKIVLKLQLIWLTIPLVISCASLPKPPNSKLCVFNSVSLVSNCYQLSPDMVHRNGIQGTYYVKIQTGTASQVQASEMINWVTMDPDSWSGIQTYVNELKAQDKQCLGL